MKDDGAFDCPLAEGDMKQPEATSRRHYNKTPKTNTDAGRQPLPIEPDEASDSEDDDIEDFWTITDDVITIHHARPRTSLYVPTEGTLPVPLKYIDVPRQTKTNCTTLEEHDINDIWNDPDRGGRDLSEGSWVGTTTFTLLKPIPKPGYEWISGRETRVQITTRPGHIWPEIWDVMGKKAKRDATKYWATYKPVRDAARE